MSHSRFAIYFVPAEGALADFGAAWLGWDVVRGCPVHQFDVPGLGDITMTPRKYGFHGTLKPPFRLADGMSRSGLEQAVCDLAATLTPAGVDGLELTALGRFLALTPHGDATALQHLAATCVRDLDAFRAPASQAEQERRRKRHLNARQEAMLLQWGYPYVMDEFRFHMTLTGRLPKATIPDWTQTVARHLPDVPSPFMIDQIALCGEREDARFELLHRYTLTG